MVLADGLLVVGTSRGLVAFDAFNGEQRWAVEDADNDGLSLDLRDEARGSGPVEAPPAEAGREHSPVFVNGYQISSQGENLRVVSPLGATWAIDPNGPGQADALVVSEGAWAWMVVPDGRLYGVDFSAPDLAYELDEIARGTSRPPATAP